MNNCSAAIDSGDVKEFHPTPESQMADVQM
jgi:hypothetical protein